MQFFIKAMREDSSVKTDSGVHFAGGIPSDIELLPEDFFLSLPEQMAVPHFVGLSNFLGGSHSRLLDYPGIDRIITDRVVENATASLATLASALRQFTPPI